MGEIPNQEERWLLEESMNKKRYNEMAKALELDNFKVEEYLKGDEKSYVQSPLEFADVA